MSAQTVACRWVRDWTPTVDCGSTNKLTGGMGPPDTRFFDDTIADRFDAVMNPSDLERRIAIAFDALLGSETLTGRSLLDCARGK